MLATTPAPIAFPTMTPDTPAGHVEAFLKRAIPPGVAQPAVIAVRDGRTLVALNTDVRRACPIGAVTKQITAAIVYRLASRGLIDLHAHIDRYLPAFGATAVMPQDLIWQQSGIPEYAGNPDFDVPLATLERTGDADALVRALGAAQPEFAAGARYGYSDSNYLLLALIARRVTGLSYAQLLDREIAAPLGLRSTLRVAPGDAETAGATGIMATPEALARWDDALLGSGPLEPATLRAFFRASSLPTTTGAHYAGGMVADALDARPLYWHNGVAPIEPSPSGAAPAGNTCLTMNVVLPAQRMAVVVMSHAAGVPVEEIAMQATGAALGLPSTTVVVTDAQARMLHRTLWWALGSGSIAIAIGIAAMLRVRRAWGWGIAAALGGGLIAVVATLGESGPSLWTLLGLLPAAGYVALLLRVDGRAT